MCRIRFPQKVLYPSDCQEFVVPGANAITARCESPSSGVFQPRNGGGPKAQTGSMVYAPPFRKWQGRRIRCPYTRPARRGSDSSVPRARPNSRACANAVHICISSVRTLRGGKGKETRPGRRFCDFLCPAREGGAVCIFVSLSAPTIRVTNKSITDCCASLPRNGGGDERHKTGNMVYTSTIRVCTPTIRK